MPSDAADLTDRLSRVLAQALGPILDELISERPAPTVPAEHSALAGLPPVLTFRELERIVPLGRTALHQRVRDGSIPRLPGTGRKLLFSRAAVERWLATSGQAEPPDAAPQPLRRRAAR
jgi:hypothetical protein